MGPVLIFDKSLLESLNPDEALWLDQFFISNVTPVFYIETLADLEKEVKAGRTPEDVVGSLAYKSPDMHAWPNTHHLHLLQAELRGLGPIDMRFGRPIISGGREVGSEGSAGAVFEESPEAAAFGRWQRREFLELERDQAKLWRAGLALIDPAQQALLLKSWLSAGGTPKTLAEVKAHVDAVVDGPDAAQVLNMGLGLLGVVPDRRTEVMRRWKDEGSPPIATFAPYFRYILGIDLFFYLARSANLISDRVTNKVDIAYLYYLPFCMVFTSRDKLHAATVPLFLREHQEFIPGAELKAELAKLDTYYAALPQEAKDRGVAIFAAHPPEDLDNLIVRLWDKYLPKWRDAPAVPKPHDPEHDARLLEFLKRRREAPQRQGQPLPSDELDYLMLQRMVLPRKGKWVRMPPEVLEQEDGPR